MMMLRQLESEGGRSKTKWYVLVLVEEVVRDLFELGQVRIEEARSKLGEIGVVRVVDPAKYEHHQNMSNQRKTSGYQSVDEAIV